MSTCANVEEAEIRISGKTLYVPSTEICGRTIIVTGKWIRTAQVKDEELVEGVPVEDPESFITKLKESELKADVFTFAQRPPEIIPKYDYHFEWDNWAAVPTTCFKDWWEKRLPQESRKNVRRAAKRGVVVRVIPFDDELVRGIQGIYNETPVRQGKPFWHFGKDFDTVKRQIANYPGRSEFVGAFLNEELIGFIKVIYVDCIAVLVQILSKNEHHDKRPMNALLAHSVELCERKGISPLIYGKYTYGTKRSSSLTEFKRRNGFEEVRFPRYFVPLNTKGKFAIRSGLHLEVANLIPGPVNDFLLKVRLHVCRNWDRSRQIFGEED
jgi:hypothetical protein